MAKTGTFISIPGSQEGATPRLVTETEPLPTALFDGYGNPIASLGGAINVHHADVHNVIVNGYIHRHSAVTTTLTAAVSPGDHTITVASTTGFSVGDYIHFGASDEYTEPYHPVIVSIVGNDITVNSPIEKSYTIGEAITQAIIDMSSQAGTLATPITYKYSPRQGNTEHIKRIIIAMVHSSAADDSTFGDVAALTNGVIFRAYISGVYYNFTSWRSNYDIILDMYNVIYTDKAGPGIYGTKALGSFSDIDVAIRLDSAAGDRMEILIQDDLTTLDSFSIKVQGHVEGY